MHETRSQKTYTQKHTHKNIHTKTYTQNHTHKNIHTKIYTQKHTHKNIHTKTYTQKHTHKNIHTKTYTQKHTHKNIHTKTYTQKYTHKNIHTKKYTQKHTHKNIHTKTYTQDRLSDSVFMIDIDTVVYRCYRRTGEQLMYLSLSYMLKWACLIFVYMAEIFLVNVRSSCTLCWNCVVKNACFKTTPSEQVRPMLFSLCFFMLITRYPYK